jgi:hypothetical protein
MSTLRNTVQQTTARRIANRFLSAGLAVAALTLAACQDGAAPASPESSLKPSGPRLTLATTAVTTAVLYPTVDNLYVSAEGHRIYIPANSVCQVGVSGYGPGTWDLPCQTATSPIVFTITSTTDEAGRPKITVQPDVRFSPSKTVTASFVDQAAANAFNALIQYCPTLSVTCVDESVSDPSLRTYTDKATGRVSRRLKHFSGYTVVFGSDGGDGEWMQDRSSLAARASGYITTTGLDGGSATSELMGRN